MSMHLHWLHPFILSGVISPLISRRILGTYPPGEFLFQHSIILPFHTVHGVLKARILKWFAIPFCIGPHSVRPLHHDPSVLGGPTQHGWVSLSETRLWSWDQIGWFSVIMVLVCLPSDALSQGTYPLTWFLLPWTWGISSRMLQESTATPLYLGQGVSPHGCPSWPWLE